MRLHSSVMLLIVATICGCQSLSAACHEAAGGSGWSAIVPPEWADPKLAELGWDTSGPTYWYFDGASTFKVCLYNAGTSVPRCGGPNVAEYSFVQGEWVGDVSSIHVCH